MRASPYASGCRLTAGSPFKLKCVVMAPWPPGSDTTGRGWSNYNSANWGARLDRIKSIGANAIKLQCSGIGVGVSPITGYGYYPVDAVLKANLQDACGQAAARGLLIYYQLCGGGAEVAGADGSALTAGLATIMKVFSWALAVAGPNIVAVDACNEINFTQPSTWSSRPQMVSDLKAMFAAVRAVAPGMPVSASVYLNSASAYANDLLKLQADAGADYHDYHPYNGINGNTNITPSQCPRGTDVAMLEAQSWFIGRHLPGEEGIEIENTSAAMSAWVNGIGDQAARPASHGACLFGDQNFPGQGEVGDYGIFDTSGSPITALTNPFRAWPGGRT